MTGPRRPSFVRLVRVSALFALGSVTGKLVGLALLPFLTRTLAPSEYGRLDVLSTLASTVTSLAVLGLDVAITRLYPDESDEGRASLFGSWLAIATLVTLPVLALAVVGGGAFSRMLFGSTRQDLGIAMVGAYAAGNLYQVIGLTALRNQGRAMAYALVSAGAFVVNGVAVVLFVHFHPSAGSAMVGMALGVAAGGVGALVVTRRLVLRRPSSVKSRALLALGLPLMPAIAATWIGDFVNRAILLGSTRASEVGFLSVAVRFGSVGVLVVSGFQLAWLPQAFAAGTSPAALAAIAKDAKRIVVAVCVSLVPIALLAPELLRLVAGPSYEKALPAIGFSLVTSIGLALFVVASMPSAIAPRMGDIGVAGSVGALTAIAANLALAHHFGATGTSAALASGQMTAIIVVARLGRTRVRLPIHWPSVVLVALAGSGLALLCTLPARPGFALRLAASAVFVAVLVVDGSVAELVRFLTDLVRRRRGPQDPGSPDSDASSSTAAR